MNANQIKDMLWLILEAKLFHNQYIFGARGLPRCRSEFQKNEKAGLVCPAFF